MTRRPTAVFLLSFLLITFLTTALVLGADKPYQRIKDRASFPARFAPVYGFSGSEAGPFSTPKSSTTKTLGPMATDAIGLQVSSTAYDYQHNCSMGRQIEHRGTDYLHFDWMDQPLDYSLPGDRGVGVESYNLIDCDLVYGGGGKRAGVDYEGYVSMDADQGGCAIPAAHGGVDDQNMSPRAYWDFCAGGPMGLFTADYPSDVYGWYQTDGTNGGNQNLWPIIDWQIGSENVLHMVSSESGGEAGDPQTLSYYRRVGGYSAGIGVWSAQRLIDTAMNINPVVTSSTTSDRVAIVWNAPCAYITDVTLWNQYENDVYYAVSDNQGADWIAGIGSGSIGQASGINVTQYDPMDDFKAYADISALITTDDNLHIVWGCRKWTDTTSLFRRASAIFHWSEDVTNIRTVVKADWDTGGACYGHTWGSDAAKMSISECDNKLYVLYTQFGNAEAPCYDLDSANSVINGELYLTVSGDNGLNWDRPQNLTNTVSHDCPIGECESDYWASMARYGRVEANGCQGVTVGDKVLDILYINDKAAGGAVQTESGVWTSNPVMWFPTPCRDVVPEPAFGDNGPVTGYGECFSDIPLVLAPGGDTTLSFTVENTGLLDNNFAITVEYTDGTGWLTPNPASGVIPSGLDNTVDIDLNFAAPVGAPDPSVWAANIVITHDAVGSPREIPACLLVASVFIRPESATLATTCKQIRIFNTGELVNDEPGSSLDFIGDCDTLNPNVASNVYLYDASPVVCRISGADTLRFTMYSASYTDDNAFRPLSPITVDEISYTDYVYATSMFSTSDTTIGIIAEYYVPKAEANCSFVIEKLKVFNMTEAAIEGVLVGEFLDWDIPTDYNYDTLNVVGTGNTSGFDETRALIYQQGAEINDSLEAPCNQQEDARFGGIAAGPNTSFKNAMTLDNATYVYTSGPFGFDAPLPAQVMYELMKNETGFSAWSSEDAESTYTDISTLVTFGEYDLAVGDTVCATKILTTSKEGLTYLTDMVDNALAFIDAQGLACEALTCCNMAGDPNNDGSVNVGDAVFVINFVFKGGTAPACMSEGDANADGSVNVGDAVYLINYVFKGGNAPICGTID